MMIACKSNTRNLLNRSSGIALALVLSIGVTVHAGMPAYADDAEFVIGAGTEPDTMGVQEQTSTAVQNYMDFIVEPLVKLAPDGSIQPGLAESWEVSEDGLTYTFHLREGVKFHDGTEFDAEAVKFNFGRLLDEDVRVPLRGQFSMIKEVEVIDTLTVKTHLSATTPAFLGTMSSAPATMMSPAAIDKFGNSYKRIVHPIGTGPYKFVEYVQAEHIKLERWESYWGEKPYFEKQTIKLIPEPASREAALLSGQADMIMQPPSADIGALQANEDVNVIIGDTTRVIYLAFNNQAEAFSDPRVRKAINHAVDKEAIIKSVLFGAAEPVHSHLSRHMASYCEVGYYDYDPEKARAMLEEAGASGLQLEIVAPAGHYIQDRQAASAIAAYLQQVGIKASVRTTDWATYLAWVAEQPEQQGTRMNMFGYAGASPEQATPGMISFFGGDFIPPNGFNTAFYSNNEVDELWRQASQEPDKEKRDALYCEAQKIFWGDAPWLFLWNQGIPIVTRADIEGVTTLPNEKYDAIYARPKK